MRFIRELIYVVVLVVWELVCREFYESKVY